MAFTTFYESHRTRLKPPSVLLTIFIVLAGITVGSIFAIMLTGVWAVFAGSTLAIQAYQRILKLSHI